MKRILAVIAIAALVTSTAATALASPWETRDVFGQGMGGPVVSEDGAKIHRTDKGVSASVTMPTPEPGSYTYPQGPVASGEEGHPEASACGCSSSSIQTLAMVTATVLT